MPQSTHSQLFGKPGSVLFGMPHQNTEWTDSSWGYNSAASVASSGSNISLGYLAFPPGEPTTPFLAGVNASLKKPGSPRVGRLQKQFGSNASHEEFVSSATEEWEAEQQRLKLLHERRLAMEAEEARKGEEYWVSCGGVLRDEHGRRDLERTKQIREELRLREVEKRLTERWEGYELRWRELAARIKLGATEEGDDDTPLYLRFEDIPWPVETQDSAATLEVLKFDRMEEFLLESLTVRSCTVSRKERIRSSLLRWHPDKLSTVIAQTDPGEREAVMQGIHAVIRCLRHMNSKV